jgi:Na+/melibiose symporter-like transporter
MIYCPRSFLFAAEDKMVQFGLNELRVKRERRRIFWLFLVGIVLAVCAYLFFLPAPSSGAGFLFACKILLIHIFV